MSGGSVHVSAMTDYPIIRGSRLAIQRFALSQQEAIRGLSRDELSLDRQLQQVTILSFFYQWAHRPAVIEQKLAALMSGEDGPALQACAVAVAEAWEASQPEG
jgi:hypothetical protein